MDDQMADDATCGEHSHIRDAINAQLDAISDEAMLQEILDLINHYLPGDLEADAPYDNNQYPTGSQRI